MRVVCSVCGAHVPAEVAIERAAVGGPRQFCSGRCADRGAAEETSTGPTAALPSLPRIILVALDGSGPSLRAAAFAARLAGASQGMVRLLCAVDSGWTGALRMLASGARQPDMSAEVEQALREDAQAQLDHGRRLCERAGVAVTTDIVFRPPYEAIVEAAREADLVVMGSRGRGAVVGVVLGSLSQRVLGGTRTPVLVVH